MVIIPNDIQNPEIVKSCAEVPTFIYIPNTKFHLLQRIKGASVPAFNKHYNMKMDGKGKVPRILNLESPAVISRGKSLVLAFRNLAKPDSHFDMVEKREVPALPGIYITMELFFHSRASYFGLCENEFQ
jgi:hypothetical protein